MKTAGQDVVKELGYLTLGSRLKRLGERMQADVSRLIKREGQNVHAGLMPTLGILAERGPTTVGDLAMALGIAQPGVTRMLVQLKQQKLVTSGKTGKDQRQRLIALTEAGQHVIDATRDEVWPRIERALAEVCKGLDGPFIEQLAAIENALEKTPLDQRAAKKMKAVK
ncbi:MAG: MarR family transcriptional regulator [Aestuariivirga sp.]